MGDAIRAADGTVGVVEVVTVVHAPGVMVNLTVDLAATYLVGDGRWVVHNVDVEELLDLAKKTKDIPYRNLVPRALTPVEIARLSRRVGILEISQYKRIRANVETFVVTKCSKLRTSPIPGGSIWISHTHPPTKNSSLLRPSDADFDVLTRLKQRESLIVPLGEEFVIRFGLDKHNKPWWDYDNFGGICPRF